MHVKLLVKETRGLSYELMMETISYHRLIPATITAAIILLFASVKAVGCVSARHSKTHGKTVMEHARILIVKI